MANSTRSVERALDVLSCFTQEEAEISLSDISRKAALSPATVTRLIASLQARGYLVRNQDNRKYYLGPTIARLGACCFANSDLRKIALPHMRFLRDGCGEDVSLYVPNGRVRTCIERVSGNYALRRIVNIGDTLPMNCSVSGKLLLAYADPGLQEELAAGSDSLTMECLSRIRERGYNTAESEVEAGLSSVAAPVFNARGEVVAALAIAGPTVRYTDADLVRKIPLVRQTALRISHDLGLERKNGGAGRDAGRPPESP